MTSLIKYEETYIITFKDGSLEEISKQGGEYLIKALVDKQWVVINGAGYNRFEIISCKPMKRDGEALGILSGELTVVQNKVKEFMKRDKAELTAGRMREMIRVAKEELYIK